MEPNGSFTSFHSHARRLLLLLEAFHGPAGGLRHGGTVVRTAVGCIWRAWLVQRRPVLLSRVSYVFLLVRTRFVDRNVTHIFRSLPIPVTTVDRKSTRLNSSH